MGTLTRELTAYLAKSGTTLGDVFPKVPLFIFGASLVPNLFFPAKTADTFYKLKEEEVTKSVTKLYDRDLLESGISGKYLIKIKTYICKGFDVINKCNFGSRWDPHFGIPLYFNFESESDVEAAKDKVVKDIATRRRWYSSKEVEPKIDWDSPAGKELKDSLLLSPSAKKFGLARMTQLGDRAHFIYSAFSFWIACDVLPVTFYNRLIRKLDQYQQRLQRGKIFAASVLFGSLSWYCIVKLRNDYFERKSEKTAASIGPDYADGAVEYFSKMLKRNRAIRELLGKEGEKLYTKKGEPRNTISSFLTTFTIPFTHLSYTERLRLVVGVASTLDEMDHQELANHFETVAAQRKMRKAFGQFEFDESWKSSDARKLEEMAGKLQFETEEETMARKERSKFFWEERDKSDPIEQYRNYGNFKEAYEIPDC